MDNIAKYVKELYQAHEHVRAEYPRVVRQQTEINKEVNNVEHNKIQHKD